MQLTTAQERLLADTAHGRVHKTATGWLIGAVTATAAERRTLTSLLARGLIAIAADDSPLEPGETTPVEITKAGAAALRRQQ